MNVKYQKMYSHALTPELSTEGAAGLDFWAIDYDPDESRRLHTYGTGIIMEIPEDHVGYLFSRSSCSKRGLILANSVGVIDSDYRGEIIFKFAEIRENPMPYEVGEKIGQLVIMQKPRILLEESKELSTTARGTGGFGSTGN